MIRPIRYSSIDVPAMDALISKMLASNSYKKSCEFYRRVAVPVTTPLKPAIKRSLQNNH